MWYDCLKSFVALTDNNQYEIYTIETTYSHRLKICLRTALSKNSNDIIKDKIFMRTDENYLYIYYEKMDGQKRLRLLNSTFECVQSYPFHHFFQNDEFIRSHTDCCVVGLGINQEHVRIFLLIIHCISFNYIHLFRLYFLFN